MLCLQQFDGLVEIVFSFLCDVKRIARTTDTLGGNE